VRRHPELAKIALRFGLIRASGNLPQSPRRRANQKQDGKAGEQEKLIMAVQNVSRGAHADYYTSRCAAVQALSENSHQIRAIPPVIRLPARKKRAACEGGSTLTNADKSN
jgi:hypothetical protein